MPVQRFSLILSLILITLSCSDSGTAVIEGRFVPDNRSDYLTSAALFIPVDNMEGGAEFVIAEGGIFNFDAEPGREYILIVISISGQRLGDYELHGQLSEVRYIRAEGERTILTFSLKAGHDFIFEARDKTGCLIDEDDWTGVRFAEDGMGNAIPEIFIGSDQPDGAKSPCIVLSPAEGLRFFFLWEVPGFGKVVLPADNGGQGYTAVAGGAGILNLNYELARTQLHRLEKNISGYAAAGYPIDESLRRRAEECRSRLDDAGGLDDAALSKVSDEVCADALWALEELELERAEADIRKHRIGSCGIALVDRNGEAVRGAAVSYRQINSDFLFGVFDTIENTGEEGFALMKEAGINYVTDGFYWNEVEPRRNKIDWDKIDNDIGVKKLGEMGFEQKAHALMAFWSFSLPEYLAEMSFDGLNTEAGRHIGALVSHYADDISIWNVINEAHGRGSSHTYNREQMTALTRTGIEAVRRNDLEGRILINNAHDWFGESSLNELMSESVADGFTLSVPAYLRQLEAAEIEYDIIGQQMYNGGYVSLFDDWDLGSPIGVPSWDLEHLSGIMDELGTFGKPFHITEQSVPSEWDDEWEQYGAGWWHRRWDQQTQAEFLRSYYKIVFSKENAGAVTWWNINDSYSFIKYGGLLDEDNKPKTSYFALKALLESWTTEGSGRTDESGRIIIEGFAGDYEVTVEAGGQSVRKIVHIEEASSSGYQFKLK